jgi:outer membrane murein-binding lipoprotein Lpp
MSHPPTDPNGWNPPGWPPRNDHGGDPAGPGRPPGQRQVAGGWSEPNGKQPRPRVYGRATPTPSHEQPPSSGQQPFGQSAPPPSYGQQPPSYGQQPPSYGQQPPSYEQQPPSYGQPALPSYGQQGTYGQPASTASYGQQPYGQRPDATASYGRATFPAPYEPPTPASPVEVASSTEPGGSLTRSRKPSAILVLAVVAGLLFVLGGIMTGLFFAKSSELSRTERDLAANVQQIDKLNRDVKAANERAAKTQQALTGTQNSRKEIERQKQVIARCLTLLVEVGQAANNGDRSAYEEAVEEAEKVCEEADRYL